MKKHVQVASAIRKELKTVFSGFSKRYEVSGYAAKNMDYIKLVLFNASPYSSGKVKNILSKYGYVAPNEDADKSKVNPELSVDKFVIIYEFAIEAKQTALKALSKSLNIDTIKPNDLPLQIEVNGEVLDVETEMRHILEHSPCRKASMWFEEAAQNLPAQDFRV